MKALTVMQGFIFQDMTGLTMETAEDFQVQNYGIGGHYAVHYDFSEEDQLIDRIATMLFYVNMSLHLMRDCE